MDVVQRRDGDKGMKIKQEYKWRDKKGGRRGKKVRMSG